MPDHVPLGEPPGSAVTSSGGAMSARVTDPGRHAWLRYFRLWDAYFALFAAGVAATVGLNAGEPVGHRAGALALIAALALWYLLLGRRAMLFGKPAWAAGVYLAGALLLFTPAVLLVHGTGFLLFALCPQAYMATSFGWANAVVVLLNLVPSAAIYAETRSVRDVLSETAPIAIMVILYSVLMSRWVDRIVRQSVERAELIEQLDASRAEVARLSHEAGVAAERQRLAGEIHDTVAQGLSSMVMLIQAAEADVDRDPEAAKGHLRTATSVARENLAETRALVAALTPAALSGASLPDAIGRLVSRFDVAATEFAVAGEARPLPMAAEVVLLRAAQEALANVRKHAAAAEVKLRLVYGPSTVTLEVRDNGRGLTPTVVGAATPGGAESGAGGGFGLAAMRARVEQLGGTLDAAGAPGEGTTIRAEVPA